MMNEDAQNDDAHHTSAAIPDRATSALEAQLERERHAELSSLWSGRTGLVIKAALAVGLVIFVAAYVLRPAPTDIDGRKRFFGVADVPDGVTHIGQSLTLTGDHDLTKLRNLQTIDGHLYLTRLRGTPDLRALSNLQRVGRDLDIRACPDLRSLDGLENLRVVGGKLLLLNMPNLHDVSALSSLTQVGEVDVSQMPILEAFDADEPSLARVKGHITFEDTPQLRHIGLFRNLKHLGGRLRLARSRASELEYPIDLGEASGGAP